MYSEKLPTIAEIVEKDPNPGAYNWKYYDGGDNEYIVPTGFFENYFQTEKPFVKCCGVYSSNQLMGRFTLFRVLYEDFGKGVYKALKAQYNILDNYNGKETHTITETNTKTGGIETTGNNTNNTTTSGENTNNTSTTATGTNTEKVTTFETENLKTAGGADTTSDSTTTDTTTTSNTLTGTATANTTQTFNNVTDTKNFSETTERAGNLGVTTSQQMVMSELDLRSKYICAKMVIDKFIEVYCI